MTVAWNTAPYIASPGYWSQAKSQAIMRSAISWSSRWSITSARPVFSARHKCSASRCWQISLGSGCGEGLGRASGRRKPGNRHSWRRPAGGGSAGRTGLGIRIQLRCDRREMLATANPRQVFDRGRSAGNVLGRARKIARAQRQFSLPIPPPSFFELPRMGRCPLRNQRDDHGANARRRVVFKPWLP
jgi:hypothetical protein